MSFLIFGLRLFTSFYSSILLVLLWLSFTKKFELSPRTENVFDQLVVMFLV